MSLGQEVKIKLKVEDDEEATSKSCLKRFNFVMVHLCRGRRPVVS